MTEEIAQTLDQIAQRRYGSDYANLSYFAKETVRQARAALLRIETTTTYGPNETDLARAISNLQQKVASLETENKDLWEENEELKIENLELIDELAKNSLGRSTGNRER